MSVQFSVLIPAVPAKDVDIPSYRCGKFVFVEEGFAAKPQDAEQVALSRVKRDCDKEYHVVDGSATAFPTTIDGYDFWDVEVWGV